MNFAGFQKILANTAAQIDKAVANTVQEVTGPKALSEYDIGDQVGSGGPGLLWKLYRGKPKSKAQQELSAEVCIWYLDKKALTEERSKRGTSKAAEEALLDIFRSDAKLMQRLRHPGVVRVVEALDENKNAMAMVTEPLFSSVANALGNYDNCLKVPEELKQLELGHLEVKHGLLQITDTLSFLHKNAKIVHRSISPETVFLTTTGGWKFGGFGFATMVDQVGLDNEAPFHYPDFDVEAPVLPLQPLLDYAAPELIRKPIKSLMGGDTRTSSDIFSLGLLTYHLVAKKPLLRCYNNQQTYLSKIMNLHRDTFQGIPLELDNDLRRMISQEAMARPTADDFSSSSWYRDDIRLRALRFLDHMLERDNLQKTEFFKALSGLWSGFDPRVLRYKVLPPLLAELKNDAILQFTLPLVLLIADNQSPRDFEIYTQPSLTHVIQTAVGETLLILVKHLPMLVSKASLDVMTSHVLPMLVRAYDDGDPRIQEETLRRTVDLALKLDFDLVKTAIVPRVHALALKTSVAAVRVHALICLGDLVQRLDKAAVMDILQTCARCAAVDHSPPTLMCILAVVDTIQKQQGVEFAAEHLLPLLTPLLVTQQLSAPQFAKFMRLVLDILHKIEEKRGVNLSEADSVSLDFAGLGAGSTVLNLSGSNETPKVFATAKPATSWDATDDWGPISKTSAPSTQNNVTISGFLEAPPMAPPPLAVTSQTSTAVLNTTHTSTSFSWSDNISPQTSSIDPFANTPMISNAAFTDPFASSAIVTTSIDPFSQTNTNMALTTTSSDPFASLTSPPAGPSMVSQYPRPQTVLSPKSSTSPKGGRTNMQMTGGSLGTNFSGLGSSAVPSNNINSSNLSKDPFTLLPKSGLSQGSTFSLGSNSTEKTEDDPFADWPPRTTGGRMLEPNGATPTETSSYKGGLSSTGGMNWGTGITTGMSGFGAPRPPVNSSTVTGGSMTNSNVTSHDWSASSFGQRTQGQNFPQIQQQPDLDSFFSPPVRTPPPQQLGAPGSMGRGVYGTPNVGMTSSGMGTGGTPRLAPPPLGRGIAPSIGRGIAPPPQGLARGRGRGQVPGSTVGFQNQSSLPDLL